MAAGFRGLLELCGVWLARPGSALSALHLRRQIRDATQALLTGLTTTAARIYVSRAEEHPMQADELPGLRLSTPNETIETLTMGVGRIRERIMHVQVELVVKSTGTPAATVDAMRKEIEIAIDADPTLGGLVGWIELRSMSVEQDAQADAPVAMGTALFEALYHTAAA